MLKPQKPHPLDPSPSETLPTGQKMSEAKTIQLHETQAYAEDWVLETEACKLLKFYSELQAITFYKESVEGMIT